MSDRQSLWDDELLQFSRCLIPAEKDIKDAKEIANKIFSALQNNRKFKIDRQGIMGSVEKKTALSAEFDLDCVIFVNDVTIDDFSTIFEIFDQTLTIADSLGGTNFKRPKTKGNALQASINGFDFDIVPAINFSQNNVKQRQMVMNEIRKLPYPARDGYHYSSSLIHDQIEFIKIQTPFVHDLIRLAKFWNRSLFISEYISGRSSLFELIAVSAGNEEEKKFLDDKSLLRAFKEFLTKVKNFNTLSIIFNKFYSPGEISPYILQQRPLVLDPSNPFNNFAHDLISKSDVLRKFEKFAQVSLQKLSEAFGGKGNILSAFEIQPSIPPKDVYDVKAHRGNWAVSTVVNNSGSKRCTIKERRDEIDQMGVRIWKHYLFHNVKFVPVGNEQWQRTEHRGAQSVQSLRAGEIAAQLAGENIPALKIGGSNPVRGAQRTGGGGIGALSGERKLKAGKNQSDVTTEVQNFITDLEKGDESWGPGASDHAGKDVTFEISYGDWNILCSRDFK